MGFSSWDSGTYSSYSRTYAKAPREQVFASRKIKPYLDPKNITIRESRDSEAHPNSTAIILGLDVTGSMGFIAEDIAKKQLGELIESILDRKPVSDPHIMFMAIGDVFCDEAPLQASQFETDIRIAEQLRDIYVEGHGGGNAFESYDVPWYFAGTKTAIDCYEKRGKRGYLFTIGDEPPPPHGLTVNQINNLFGTSEEKGFTSDEMLKLAQEKYNVFHVVIEEGSHASRYKAQVYAAWERLLGKKVIHCNDYKCLAQIITSVMEVNEGAEPEDVISGWENPNIQSAVRYALFGGQ